MNCSLQVCIQEVSTVCMIHNCERLELVFVKVMCKIRYRRISRLLKQVSSVQFVKLNAGMADNRFGGVVLKPSRIGSQTEKRCSCRRDIVRDKEIFRCDTRDKSLARDVHA